MAKKAGDYEQKLPLWVSLGTERWLEELLLSLYHRHSRVFALFCLQIRELQERTPRSSSSPRVYTFETFNSIPSPYNYMCKCDVCVFMALQLRQKLVALAIS